MSRGERGERYPRQYTFVPKSLLVTVTAPRLYFNSLFDMVIKLVNTSGKDNQFQDYQTTFDHKEHVGNHPLFSR